MSKRVGLDYWKGKHRSEETKLKISQSMKGVVRSPEHQSRINISLKGRKMPEGFGRRISKILTGRKHTEEELKKMRGRHNSPKTEFKKGVVSLNWGKKANVETRLKQRLARIGRFSGEKCGTWKGGITPINKAIRSSDTYKQWRTSIFIRDDFTCQDCGTKHIYVVAHHIKPFSLYPELRFEEGNGITLCQDCHKKTESFAGKIKKYKELI